MNQSHSQSSQKMTFDPNSIVKEKIYVASAKFINPVLGYGVFAKKPIKKGEVIFIIKGKKIPLKIKDTNDSALLPNAISLGKELWLDPFKENPLTYLNHSCNPNSALKGSVSVVAIKPIKKNEQVTIDYSITEWDKYWKLDKVCKCGSKDCRKTIRSIHSLPLKIYSRYLPYIPKFLQREYTLSNKIL